MPIDRNNFPATRADVPGSHHPSYMAKWEQALDADGTPGQMTLTVGVSALKALYVAQAEVMDTRRSLAQHLDGKPVSTPRGLKLRHGMEAEYAAGVQRQRERVLKSFDAYHQQVAGTCDHLRAKLMEKLRDTKTSPALQAEIRAHVRSLPERERMTFVAKQELATYAAVATAPSFLSGLTSEQLSTLEDKAHERFAPVERVQNVAVNEVYAHLAAVRAAFIKWADAEISEANTPAARAAAKVKALGK